MSAQGRSIPIQIFLFEAYCDACGTSGGFGSDLPHRLVLVRHKEQLLGYMNGPTYQIEGGPGESAVRRDLLAAGWTIERRGEREMVFCPRCSLKPEEGKGQ